ncbi:MAG: hypothetical protein IJ759_06435 [Bacteroidales bacterium]|nr:hypothetical protein [Bacteroidales bacterium]
MKKNIWKTFAAILFFSVVIPVFSGCGDDLDGCGLTVVAVDGYSTTPDGQNNTRLVGAKVHVGKNNGTITRDDVTDNHGEAYFFFYNEAIFDVTVSYGVSPDIKTGTATVRLKEGQVVTKVVPLY